MQDKYVGDIGDFGKYGLLRSLCLPEDSEPGPSLRLGVVWYLFSDETNTNDGNKTEYLFDESKRKEFKPCDPELFAKLQKIVADGKRSVRQVRDLECLPPETAFYEDILSYEGISGQSEAGRMARCERRSKWFEKALKATAACDLVFLDPDIGLEVKVRKYQQRAPKYVYLDEIKPYLDRGQSLVVYQHLGRNGTARDQIEACQAKFREHIGHADVFAMWYHRGTARVFFVLPSEAHRHVLIRRMNEFLEKDWRTHFSLLDT